MRKAFPPGVRCTRAAFALAFVGRRQVRFCKDDAKVVSRTKRTFGWLRRRWVGMIRIRSLDRHEALGTNGLRAAASLVQRRWIVLCGDGGIRKACVSKCQRLAGSTPDECLRVILLAATAGLGELLSHTIPGFASLGSQARRRCESILTRKQMGHSVLKTWPE